jgi:hypothetical protein
MAISFGRFQLDPIIRESLPLLSFPRGAFSGIEKSFLALKSADLSHFRAK